MPPLPADTNFFVWALVIVCGTLAALAGSVIKWQVNHYDLSEKLRKEELDLERKECKSERKEDQRLFLASLTVRDTQLNELTTQLKKLNDRFDRENPTG